MLSAPHYARDRLRVQLGLCLDQPNHLHRGPEEVPGWEERKHEQEHFNSDVSQDAVKYLFQGVKAKSGIQTSNQQIPSFNVDAFNFIPSLISA